MPASAYGQTAELTRAYPHVAGILDRHLSHVLHAGCLTGFEQ